MALKINDPRVGNWYKYIKTSDNSNEWVYEQISNGCMIDVAVIIGEPIPLTPEILEKCGFNDSGESVGSHWYYKLVSIPTNHINVTYELSLFTTEEGGKYGINLEEQYFGYCQFLHQLQNIYFALTGEELIYNPK